MTDQHATIPNTIRHHALRQLDAFVGTWQTVGDILETAESPGVRMHATDRYHWLPGGAFLAHHWDARMPDGRTQGLELIGFDETPGTYSMHAFDSHGTLTIMQATVDGNQWTFTGDALRFSGGFRDAGGTFAGRWEMRDEASGAWVPWMDLTLTRSSRD
jgi:Protein of unknown function (DUF1579)